MRYRWARNFFGSDLLDNLGYLINVLLSGVLTANIRLKGPVEMGANCSVRPCAPYPGYVPTGP